MRFYRMRILDRYLLKNFLTPFAYAFLGFIAIWLVIDLSDNGPDFIEAKVAPLKVLAFYATQLPDITVICLPVGLLLAVLYCLTRMSRSNEVISCLTAGVALPRFLLPIFLFGLVLTGFSAFLNHRLAPAAQSGKEKALKALTDPSSKKGVLEAHLFRNRQYHRTWYAERVLPEQNILRGLQVIQQDEQGNIMQKYFAREAFYNPDEHAWYLQKGVICKYTPEGDVISKEWLSGDTVITGWDETPWRIASSTMRADILSVPELRDYLEYNHDFPAAQLAPFQTHLQYRRSLPWACFIVPFLAAPLAIVFSRRGVLTGVATALFLFFGLLFLDKLFLALGEGARIAPAAAAWTPTLLFLASGLCLLYLRSNNRDWRDLLPGARKRRP